MVAAVCRSCWVIVDVDFGAGVRLGHSLGGTVFRLSTSFARDSGSIDAASFTSGSLERRRDLNGEHHLALRMRDFA